MPHFIFGYNIIMKNKSINAWISGEIASFKKIARHSKIKFFILALLHVLTNIATIVTAVIAIWLLVTMSKDYSFTGVILASLSAASVIILFFIHSFIVIYRSFMKNKFYEEAIDKIELEVMKCSSSQENYDCKDSNLLLAKNIEKISKTTLDKKINKKARSILVKSLLGDANA